jgi:serine/threonine protein kinase
MTRPDPAILNQIFLEALNRSEAERAAFLIEACAGNPQLQEEVESLLATATATGDLSDAFTHLALPDLGDDRYVVQTLIGKGGMGQVYRVLDRQLDCFVAIKAIRPALASEPEFVRRLAREAKLAASLDHPFICKVHELIQRDNGQVFVLMEFVKGETLRAMLKKGALELSDAVRIARQLAEALSFAHKRNLVHRDIKPGNIMVTSDGQIKVMDFGLAKLFDSSDEPTLTGPGQILGTPAYMSPEQAAGGKVDHRSDIFSFGMVFYECLTGDLPFESVSTTVSSHEAAIAPLRPLPGSVPRAVRNLVRRCLVKSPDGRLANLEVARTELGKVSSQLSATDLTLWQRIRLFTGGSGGQDSD